MDLRTAKERKREQEHVIIRNQFLAIRQAINNGEGRIYSLSRIYGAVSEWTRKAKLREGRGYTAQAVRNIIQG